METWAIWERLPRRDLGRMSGRTEGRAGET